ncbi:hypothetical protein J7E83_06135 [Arthrobacter sp. ISL-48]|uniref:hypothetical protein n=1 Tax=Arthrobacter sp. ISL-48 TaxID=2819110 RepID=UPI001BED1D58|nr:hypothetical protein [Arthrobacter sp. ISL-48]MBT2531705.1 hypothetical protein [Arthrobacter sp. ISL-48]
MGIQLVALGAAAILLAGCSPGSSGATSPVPGTTATVTATPSLPRAPTPVPTRAADATAVGTALKAAVPTITAVTTLTEAMDTGRLLGRPGQYLSAAWITDSGAAEGRTGIDGGAVVEVFANAADAQERSDSIQGVLKKASPVFGNEWHHLKGGTLLRVSGKLAASTDDQYASAFYAIGGA